MVQCLPHTVHTILWWRVGVRFHLNHQKRVKLSVRCCQRVINKQAFTVLCYGNLWSLVVNVVRLWRKEKKKGKESGLLYSLCSQTSTSRKACIGAFLSCWEYRNDDHKRRIFQYQFQIVFISVVTFSMVLAWRN